MENLENNHKNLVIANYNEIQMIVSDANDLFIFMKKVFACITIDIGEYPLNGEFKIEDIVFSQQSIIKFDGKNYNRTYRDVRPVPDYFDDALKQFDEFIEMHKGN